MSWFLAVSTWLTARIGSVGTELLAGVLLESSLELIGTRAMSPWWRPAFALLLSLIYEEELDRNGWSWADFWQRGVGILGAAVVWAVI